MSASIPADELELADRLAELAPLAGVLRGDLQRALGDADGLRGDPRPGPVEGPHREREPVAFGADAVRVRDADASEAELGRRRAADAHLVLHPRELKPGVPFSTMKQDRFRWRAASASIGDREHRHEVRDVALADEPLRAVDDVAVAVAHGPGPDRGGVQPASASVRAKAMSFRPAARSGNQRCF